MRTYDVICADGWTSGNPGFGGFRITDMNGKLIIDGKSKLQHTNNYFELYGVYSAVTYAAAEKENTPVTIYTDSATVIYWITSGKHSATKDRSNITKMIERIRTMLHTYPSIKVLKWDTASRGQIPADAGRKT